MQLQPKTSSYSIKYKILYESIMGILAFIAVTLVFVELTQELSPENTLIISSLDTAIWIIFIIEYFLRFLLASKKKDFFMKNLVDLIAVLPFNSIFRAARFIRIMRIVKITKLSKSLKTITTLGRFIKKSKRFITTNHFHYMLFLTFFIVVVGALGIYYVEDMNIADSIWWSFVTVTTVGYGDISPASSPGRIIASILMITGIGFLGSLTGTITTFFVKKEPEMSYKSQVIEEIKLRLDDFDNLSAEDIDTMYSVMRSLKK